MLKIEHAYWLIALFLAGAAWLNLRERRWPHAVFWAVLAALLAGGAVAAHAARASGRTRPSRTRGRGAAVASSFVRACPADPVGDAAGRAVRRPARDRRPARVREGADDPDRTCAGLRGRADRGAGRHARETV